MTWMDVERSKTMDVTVPKDAKGLSAQERNMSYAHRRSVANVIQARLQAIKNELDGVVEEEHPHHTAQQQAAADLSNFIKGQRFRDGKLLISYIDGSSHEGVQELSLYNDYCRRRLNELVATNEAASKVLVPAESDFATGDLFSVMEERMALSSMRRPSAAIGEGAERSPTPSEEDEKYLEKKHELMEREDVIRNEYNERATATSRYLQSFACIRDAGLEKGFDA